MTLKMTAFFILLLIPMQIHAYPVVVDDQNIFTDDKDSNLYYFYPDHMALASGSATNHKLYGCFEDAAMAYVNGVFTFENSPQLSDALAAIKKSNPNAKFAAVPIKTSRFIDKHIPNVEINCPGSGGVIGSQMACTWQIHGAQACSVFKKEAATHAGIHILDFGFTFYGIVQGQSKDVTRVVPVIISDIE